MYRALYRKWRPQRFEDVVGQKATVTALKNQITAGRIGHAYLFTGVRGTGKTTCAKIFAKAVNCLDPQEGDPCGQCACCRGIDNGSILDVVEMDAASNNGVDDIRDLRDETAYTPSTCRYKVYIIDEVHMLSMQAFNALLKTLEEPPAHVIFILATTEIQKVPATILSRCQRYDFTRIRPEDIAERVAQIAAAEQLDLTAGAAGLIARLADGALRDALSILDTCAGVTQHIDEDVVRRMAGVTDKSYLFRISDAVAAGDSAAALAQLAQLRQQSVDMKRLTEELIGHYRNLMLAALPGGRELLTGVAPEEEARYLESVKAVPQAEAIRAIRTLGAALEKITRGNNQRIELELAVFALTEGPLPAPEAPAARAAAPAAQNAAGRPFSAAPAPQPLQPFASANPAARTAAPEGTAQPPTAGAGSAGSPAQPDAPVSAQELPPWETAEAAPAAHGTPAADAAPDAQRPAVPQMPPVGAENRAAADSRLPDALAAGEERNKPASADGETAEDNEPDEPDAPLPEDGDAPVEGTEALPWDSQPAPPAEVPEPKPETPVKTPEPAPQQAGPAPGQIEKFGDWEKVVKVLEERDPMLYGTLKHSRAYYDGRRVLIDGGSMFRDFIRANRDSQKLLKKVIAEVTDLTCGIGPYEPRQAAERHSNAEQALEALQRQGLPVVIQDTARKTSKEE